MHTLLARNPVTAREDERPQLTQIDQLLARVQGNGLELVGPDGVAVSLPDCAVRLLHDVVHRLLDGQTVTIVPVGGEVTTQEAADMLDVSHPFLIRLLDQGAVPFTGAGTHRRIRVDDLLAFRRRRDAERREALQELTRLSEELGLYDIDNTSPKGDHAARRPE